MSYDYKQGKNRIETILDNYMEIEEKNRLPSDDNFTFENGYISWVTAIFVDLRDSTTIFANSDEPTAKLIRAFTSEVIEILRGDDNLREIGIRGDCVYAIYTTPTKKDIAACANKTFYVNTFINMLNAMLSKRNLQNIRVGIGMASDKELVIKTGRKGIGINDKVWIGKAVTVASKLSAVGDKNFNPRITFSSNSYNNFIEEFTNEDIMAKSWFTQVYNYDLGIYMYKSGVIMNEFNNWIQSEV